MSERADPRTSEEGARGYEMLFQAAQFAVSRADETSRWMMLRSSWLGAACAGALLLAFQQFSASPAPAGWGAVGRVLVWQVWLCSVVLLAYTGRCVLKSVAPRPGVSTGEAVRQLLRKYESYKLDCEDLAYELAFVWYEPLDAGRPDVSVVIDAYREADERAQSFERGVKCFVAGLFCLAAYMVIRVFK